MIIKIIKIILSKRIERMIPIDPIKAKKKYELYGINNRLYKLLSLYLKLEIDTIVYDDFFESDVKINNRTSFNYFNYIIQWERPLDALEILNNYFYSKKISSVKKISHCKPLYINNIECSEKLLPIIYRMKTISIIMTVFNEESLFLRSLESIFNQTYVNFHVIVVDDASTDSTPVILKEAKSLYKDKLTIITLKENQGTYIAKNIALTYAKGDLIAFQDADDWSHPQRIAEHVKLHNNNVLFSFSKLVRITNEGLFFSKHIYPLDRLSMVSLMIDKKIIDEIGFFRKLRIGSDTEYFERIKRFTSYKFHRIDKVLMLCAHKSNSLTTSPNTGVESFGISSIRNHHRNRWNTWHTKLKKSRRKPYVSFDRSIYSYSIL